MLSLDEFVMRVSTLTEDSAEGEGDSEGNANGIPGRRRTVLGAGGVAHIGSKESQGGSNAVHAGTVRNSPIQQAVAAAQTVSFELGSQQRADLERLLTELTNHLGDLDLDERSRRKAEAQIATMRGQLADDEPESGIILQAGRTLRNITEGAIAGLIAVAVQPSLWHWAAQTLAALFPH